jgi:D-alanine-D-alanine ligase
MNVMQKKINVAILTGGKSAELEISLASAKVVAKNLNKDKYDVLTVNISTMPWSVYDGDKLISTIDLNDFSFMQENIKHIFDVVFMAIHGTPAEDGRVQGYFELLNIPYTCSGTLASAITFDKDICKKLIQDDVIKQARSILLNDKNVDIVDIEKEMELPVFVKPNKNGSSYGIFKVNDRKDLYPSIKKAFEFDDEVLVEEFIDGRELACGVIEKEGELIALPITEIISENEFFDYEAKYLGKAKEVTPAEIPNDIRDLAQAKAKEFYRKLKLKGAIRVDYFLKGTALYLLEVNTIPGLSSESILPQEAIAHGFTLEQFFDIMIVESLREL